MDLNTILTKEKEDLTEEEKTFLIEHKSELTGGQCEEYKDILEGNEEVQTPAPTEEVGLAEEPKDEEETTEE